MSLSLSVDVRKRAEQSGREWARALSAGMHRDGRPVEGGFPGTLSEARMRALGDFEPTHLVGPLGSEIVRAVYTAARAGWSASCRSKPRPDPA